jgi:hypothetical protein
MRHVSFIWHSPSGPCVTGHHVLHRFHHTWSSGSTLDILGDMGARILLITWTVDDKVPQQCSLLVRVARAHHVLQQWIGARLLTPAGTLSCVLVGLHTQSKLQQQTATQHSTAQQGCRSADAVAVVWIYQHCTCSPQSLLDPVNNRSNVYPRGPLN